MMKKLLLFLFGYLSIFVTNQASAQCFTITDTTTCKINKKFNSDFELDLEKKWETANIVGQYHTPTIMDLDNDCIPEIIIAGAKGLLTNWEAAKEILVINSIDGSIKTTISLPFYFMLSVQNLAILILEDEVSIIISVEDENINSTLYRGKLVSVDLDGTINWISDTKFGINTPLSFRTLSIADFNQDGIPEVFLYNEIFNGKTGIKLIDGDSNGCGLGFGSVTLAANLDNDPNDLELIAGYTIYKVILTNPNGLIGNNMLAFNMTLDGTERDGMTALADINNDKQLDVIVQTYNTFYSAIYIYTFNNGKCELLASRKWNKFVGMGMVAIGRLNDSNRNYLIVPTSDTIRTFFYDNSIDLKEGLLFPIDNSTVYSGITLFDFNGDGIHEIIYRGEKNLTITGIKNDVPFLIKSIPCISGTAFEYPIVSTLQNPIISYICTTCSNSFNDLNGRLTVFGAPDGQRWAPARPIWHQYAYNPLYINDDGTVPQYMHNPATYKNGKYNNFMVQESLIDEDGNYPVPAASLSGTIDCIDYDAATDEYLVTFSMSNRSDASLTSPIAVPISLYDGDPSLAGRLLTTYRTTATVAAGGTLTGLTTSIPASSTSGRLYLVVNTDRIAPLTIDSSGYEIDECDYTDNVYQSLLPTVTSTTASICTGETYTYYGRDLTTSGTYIHEVTDSKGCDSVIVRLLLIVKSCAPPCNTDEKCYTKKPYIFSSNPSEKLKAEKKWEIDNIIVYQNPQIIDAINNDGIPELIVAGPTKVNISPIFGNEILIIDTKNKSIAKTITTAYYRTAGVASYIIADVDNDCAADLIVLASHDILNPVELRGRIVRYDLEGNIIWISDQKYGIGINVPSTYIGASIALADFNQDGLTELYVNNEIFNAQTGVRLCEGGDNGVGYMTFVGGGGYMTMSCAADLDDDPTTLELVAGYSVYKVNITNPNGQAGNQMKAINLAYNGRLVEGSTNLADINGDGKLDIVVSANSLSKYIPLKIYGYTIEADTARLLFNLEQSDFSHNVECGGPIAIGKIKDNQSLELILVQYSGITRVGDSIVSYSYIGNQKLVRNWSYRVKDNTIITGISLFDLDNDGYKEVIHRDEESLKVIGLKNNIPTLIYQYPCISATIGEMVRIADIDGSGQAKICTTCARNHTDYNGRLTIFGAPDGQRWAPARGIWHQYAYNPLFINDDGTVPQYMHNPATYQNGKYNNFMVQESLIDEDGNYPVPAASLTGTIDCIDYDAATDAYLVTFSMSNRSDASLTSPIDVPISLYDGDPSLAGRLLTTYRTTASLAAGGTLSGLTTSIPASSVSGRLYLVVNTDRIAPLTIDSSGYQIDECDYTDNVYQALLPTLTSTTASICTGETYTYYGRALTTAGTYIHEVTDSKGCDSMIVRLALVVSDTKTQSLTQRECEVYVWGDTTILSSGTYVQRDLSVSGCDSITTLDLTIYPKYSAARTVRSCDSFSYAGVRYTRDAIILDDRQSIYGCDSTTTIDLRIHPSITQDITRAACVNYMWNGTTYTDSGNYTYRGITSMGCDSIVNLALTISNVLTSTQAISGCDRYLWNGTTYTESGTYTYAGMSVSGCDSLATLNLSIGKSQSLTERATACDRYSWNGQLLTASGDYTYTTANISGCDSTTVLSLTLNRSTTADIVQSSCNTYLWNGTTYTTSGNYSYLAQTSNGCDSTVRLVLTILAPDRTEAKATACGNYPWNGTTYDRSGTYTYQTLNGVGCDSTVTLDLTIHPVAQSSMSLTACDSIVLHGRTLKASGDYTFELATQYGCDSIVTLSFTTQSDRQSISLTACDTYTWAATGDTYTQSGRYSASYTNAAGCDSTQVLNLQIAPSYLTTQNANACERYTWPTNQITYTQSGDYTLRLNTQAGCDSIQTLALRIDPVFEYRDTVTSATTYTWPINAQDYEQTGVYSEVYQSISVCDSVYWLHLTIKSDIDIYTPNILSTNGPNNYFTLFSNNPSVAVETMNIYDRWGNLIYSKQNFPLNDPTSGWDGKMGGRAVVPGVYVWVAVLRLPDGTQVTKQGDVTVL